MFAFRFMLNHFIIYILKWVAMASPEGLPYPGIKPTSPMSPASAGGFFITSAIWKALCL